MEQAKEILDIHYLPVMSKKNKKKYLYKMKDIRKELHKKKDNYPKNVIKEIKTELVEIDPYIFSILKLPNNEKYYFLKILVSFSMDEHSAFKESSIKDLEGTKQDCRYDNVMKFANKFNSIYSKTRSLEGCYDCGTIGRAIFMAYKEYKEKCFILDKDQQYCPIIKIKDKNEINRISTEYSLPQYDEKNNELTNIQIIDKCLKRLKDPLINKNGNLYILSVGMPDSIGHIWTIEVINNDKLEYRVYQSSLNEYLLVDYNSLMDYNGNNNLNINFIENFFDTLKLICLSKNWDNKTKELYYSLFYHYPQIPTDIPFFCNFMFASLYI